MCFGKNKSQNDEMYKPRPNNYCGGFALYAVLADMIEIDNPKDVYDQIQKYQDSNILSGKVYDFLSDNTKNGTKMSLPSGICAAFHEYKKDVAIKVYYTSTFAGSSFKELIVEETERLNEQGVTSYEGEANVQKYALVLVKETHWIAIKKESENSFFCYDPADGKQIEGDSMLKAITNKGYKAYDVNGLYITIP